MSKLFSAIPVICHQPELGKLIIWWAELCDQPIYPQHSIKPAPKSWWSCESQFFYSSLLRVFYSSACSWANVVDKLSCCLRSVYFIFQESIWLEVVSNDVMVVLLWMMVLVVVPLMLRLCLIVKRVITWRYAGQHLFYLSLHVYLLLLMVSAFFNRNENAIPRITVCQSEKNLIPYLPTHAKVRGYKMSQTLALPWSVYLLVSLFKTEWEFNKSLNVLIYALARNQDISITI